jgi:hypothetical protein
METQERQAEIYKELCCEEAYLAFLRDQCPQEKDNISEVVKRINILLDELYYLGEVEVL